MKKLSKRVLSVVLSLLIISLAVVPSFAYDADPKKDCPHIYVHGFMAQDIFVDPSDPNSELAWPLNSKSILKAVAGLVLPITKLAQSGDWEAFADDIVPVADELFAPVSSDFSGDVTNGSGIRFEYPNAEDIEKDSTLIFSYDWRVDPIETAGELNKFIDYVLAASDSEQVTLSCHSLGGVITLSYLTLYGNEKVKSVVFNTTAIYGETYTGELFAGQIVLDDAAVQSYMDFAFDGMEAKSLLTLLIGALTDAGVVGFVCDYANEILDEIYDQISLSVVRIFANWPTIWAMVPDEMLSDAENYVYNEIYGNSGIDCSGLKEKVENYNKSVRKNKTQTLIDLNKTTNVYVLARYGYSSLPMTPSWENLSDGVIDTKHNSFGATTAKFNQTLDVEDSEYLSPDKRIDASTCLFPEQTWFIKDMKHADLPECVNELIEKLLYHDGQATVDTYEEYPRYLVFDSENGVLNIDDGSDNLSVFDKLCAFVGKVLNFFLTKLVLRVDL